MPVHQSLPAIKNKKVPYTAIDARVIYIYIHSVR